MRIDSRFAPLAAADRSTIQIEMRLYYDTNGKVSGLVVILLYIQKNNNKYNIVCITGLPVGRVVVFCVYTDGIYKQQPIA